MATNIIDAFIVTFGLDARDYRKGERDVRDGFKRTREDAKSTFDDVENRAKKGGQAIRSLSNDVVGLILVFAGAKSVMSFATNLITTTANASRLGETLGMTAGRVVGWEKAMESVGGATGDADAALQSMQRTIMDWKLTPTSVNPGLLAMGVGPADMTSGPEHLLMKLAEARKNFSAPEYASRLGMLGLPQGAIYLLEQGPKGVKKLVDEMEKHAKITKTDEDAAKAFQKAMVDLSTTIEGQVRPAVTSMLKEFNAFVAKVEFAKAQLPDLNTTLVLIGVTAGIIGAPFVALAAAIALVVTNFKDLQAAWKSFEDWYGSVSSGTDSIMDPVRKALGLKTGEEAQRDGTDVFGHPVGGGSGAPRRAPPAAGPKPAPGQSTEDFLRQQGWTIETVGGAGTLRDQAEAAITGIGGRITSRTRSYAEQKALYDRYIAYRQGRGPWAPLAARPGTSAHETGRALDIGYGAGVSLKSIAAALLSRHIPFNDLRNEGNHYHVALGARAAMAGAHRASSGSSTTHVGPITIHTSAPDGRGIARDLHSALKSRGIVGQADRGLAS